MSYKSLKVNKEAQHITFLDRDKKHSSPVWLFWFCHSWTEIRNIVKAWTPVWLFWFCHSWTGIRNIVKAWTPVWVFWFCHSWTEIRNIINAWTPVWVILVLFMITSRCLLTLLGVAFVFCWVRVFLPFLMMFFFYF
jgi:hypothetical protein